MRHFTWILFIAVAVMVCVAGCTVDFGGEPVTPTPAPAASLPPASVATETPATTIETPATIATTIPTPVPTPVPTPDPLGDSTTLTTVQTIIGGSGSQSINVTVPNGYWEMWYTADPIVSGGQDSHSATGTNSAVFPSLSVVIRNAANGDEIETVEPPGGLDIYLWQRSGDPRPWSRKFYNGNRMFIFDITARHLKTYLIEIRVPKI